MKKINKLWLLAMPLAFAACTNEALEEVAQPASGGFTLHCTVEDAPATRAYVQVQNGDKTQEHFWWEDNDYITVYDVTDLSSGSTFVLTGSGQDASTPAVFASEQGFDNGTDVAAIYPAQYNPNMVYGLLGLEIPHYGDALIGTEYNDSWYVEDRWKSYMRERMFMYASGKVENKNADMHFRHLYAMGRITFINTTDQEQKLHTVGLVGDGMYFASQLALDVATGETMPVTTHNLATITFDNGGKTLQPGESCDAYLIFFPGEDFGSYGSIQVMNGTDDMTPEMDITDILMANPGATGFEAGKRYWFNVIMTDEGLQWGKKVGPVITNLPLIQAIEEDQGVHFEKTDSGYVNVYENYTALQNITWLNVSNRGLTDLSGIELLPRLEDLYCYYNNLTTLDVSNMPQLRYLRAWGNQLTEVKVHPNLTEINVDTNNLSTLDLSQCSEMKRIYCKRNSLTDINLTENKDLIYLDVRYNMISSIDLSENSNLEKLYVMNNQLTELDVTKNTQLKELDAEYNSLTTIDVSKNGKLERLILGFNQLTSLDVTKNTALLGLGLWGNQLTSIDISQNKQLDEINCHTNRLTELDITNNEVITKVRCGYQQKADGSAQKIGVILTDQQKWDNVVNMDWWENNNVALGPINPAGSNSNTGGGNFSTGGKF